MLKVHAGSKLASTCFVVRTHDLQRQLPTCIAYSGAEAARDDPCGRQKHVATIIRSVFLSFLFTTGSKAVRNLELCFN